MSFLNILPVLLLLPLALLGQWHYDGGLVRQNFDSLPLSETFDYSDHGVSKGPALLAASHDRLPRGVLAQDQCLFEFRRHRQARGVALIPE